MTIDPHRLALTRDAAGQSGDLGQSGGELSDSLPAQRTSPGLPGGSAPTPSGRTPDGAAPEPLDTFETAGPADDHFAGSTISRGPDEGGRAVLYGTRSDDRITVENSRNGIVVSDGITSIELEGVDGSGAILRGGGGDDTIVVADDVTRSLRLEGGDGKDELVGGGGQDILVGGDGDDHLRGGANADILWGGDGNDTLEGGASLDNLYGLGGDDVLYGGSADEAENSALDPALERDHLSGGHGDDELYGQGGTDTLFGGVGADTLDGGREDDVLFAGPSGDRDTLIGGDGSDVDRAFFKAGDVVQNIVDTREFEPVPWDGDEAQPLGTKIDFWVPVDNVPETERAVMQDAFENIASTPVGEQLLEQLDDSSARVNWFNQTGSNSNAEIRRLPTQEGPHIPESDTRYTSTLDMQATYRGPHAGSPGWRHSSTENILLHELRHVLDIATGTKPTGTLAGLGTTPNHELSAVGLPWSETAGAPLAHDDAALLGERATENEFRATVHPESTLDELLRPEYGRSDVPHFEERFDADVVGPFRNGPKYGSGE